MPPRTMVKTLTAALEAERTERTRLQEANETLKLQLAELLRGSGALERAPETHCPICFQPLADSDLALECSHKFCRSCCIKHFHREDDLPDVSCRGYSEGALALQAPPARQVLVDLMRPEVADHRQYRRRLDAGRHPDRDAAPITEGAETITLLQGASTLEIRLEDVAELFTLQYLVSQLPAREDGLERRIVNAQ